MQELCYFLACFPRSLPWISTPATRRSCMITGLQHDWGASMNWPVSSVQNEFGALTSWARLCWAACWPWLTEIPDKFLFLVETLRPVYGVQTAFFLLVHWLFKLREISWWKVVVTVVISWVRSPSEKTPRKAWVFNQKSWFICDF